METRLYMVRHAESPFVFGEERTRELSSDGKLAAKKVSEILANKSIDRIVSSPYTRAVQTVKDLARLKELTIEEYEELRERPIKGLNYKMEESDLVQAIEQSFSDKTFCLAGGESNAEAQQRSIPLIKKFLHDFEGKSIVIGTHGNIMTIMMNYFDSSYGYDFWKNTSKPDIYELVFEKDRLIVVNRLWQEE